MTMTTAQMVAVLVAGVACVSDLRTRRIPNALTFGAAGAAVLFHVWTGGLAGGLASVGGLVVGAGLMFVLFALGGMGAGDVKLLAALGAWLGPINAVWMVLYTGIAGGVIALVVAALHGYLGQACRNIRALLAYWHMAGIRPMAELTLDTGRGPRLAYATSILAGTVVTIWLR
jgi:prepilin peptidase CpaA